MRPLSASELFDVWEKGLHQSLFEKTACLLSKAYAIDEPERLGHLSIGDRDARLLQLREWTFGPRLHHTATCPNCHETLEWQSSTSELYLQSISSDLCVRTFELDKHPFRIRFRLPDSFDILKAAAEVEESKAVLKACILEINGADGPGTVDDLGPDVWDELEERMGKEDPQANISMKLICPACSCEWNAVFDIVSFFWAEINNWVQRTMLDVCQLASAFGWSEKDILSMSAQRRQLYIQMISK